jgi:hypothetical protein
MISRSTAFQRLTGPRVFALACLALWSAGCAGDGVGPNPASSTNADSVAATPTDSSTITSDTLNTDSLPPGSSALSALPGISFGVAEMQKEYFSTIYTGTQPGGMLDPSNMLSWLSAARAKGARVVVKLCKGRDLWVKNADGTFSFTKWKALVDRYKAVNFSSYINDGTVLGHYLIDEPSRPERWGGKVISQSQIEAMAAYSKKIWPNMPTLVRVVPSWLAKSSITYTHLDAAWFQYAARFGDPAKAIAAEVAIAKSKGLGLVTGMNVLDGGNGSSGIPGYTSGKWKMSATEIRNYGGGLLSNSYVCGFFTWMWDIPYYSRTDIKSAMTALSIQARAHARTSCRQ